MNDTENAVAEGVDALTLTVAEGNKDNDVTVAMEATVNEEQEDIVNPWHVTSMNEAGIDYDKLIS